MFELFQKFVTIFIDVCIVLFIVLFIALVVSIVATFTALVVESRLDKPQAVYEYGGKHD